MSHTTGEGRTGSKRLLARLTGALVVLAVLAAGGWCLVEHPWTNNAEAQQQPARDAFAADRDPEQARPAAFDARRAMGYLQAICRIGPRISGTEGMKKQQELLEKHFTDLGGKVEYQRFKARQLSQTGETPMANMVISWHPDRARRVILCSHYDTRPIADQEPDPRRWRDPFVSANDGGSGVATLMELAHHMKDLPARVGVDFVLFDGEEYIFEPKTDKYFFGSKHFAVEYRKQKKVQYGGAVLLDMTAGKNAHFPIEQNSWWKAGALVREVWTIAEQQRCTAFRSREFSKVGVEDDHIALNQVGIPAVDIIDFDYPHWHRLTDVPENCSPEIMEQVARVLTVWLQRTR
jgi:glutaminyl-peptide cyclotransferase